MKPLVKVGKDDPKGWEALPSHYRIALEPQDDNELPVPYYDSDDEYVSDTDRSDAGCTTCDDTDSEYLSDTSSCRGPKVYTYITRHQNFRTVVAEELDFVDE